MDRLPSMSTREVSRLEVMQGVARKQQPDRGQCHLPEFLQDFNARFGEDPGNTVNLQSAHSQRRSGLHSYLPGTLPLSKISRSKFDRIFRAVKIKWIRYTCLG